VKPNRLSHSAAQRFQSCGESYRLHYIEKLRSKYQSAALIFGSALDHAINALLKKDKKTPEDVFMYNWRFAEIAGNREYLPDSPKIVYSNTDFDKDLLTQEDYTELEKKTALHTKEDILEYYKKLSDLKKSLSWDKMSIDDKKMYNAYNWLSLRRKALLMITAYKTDVLPKIKKIHAVQRFVDLQNDDKDKIIGYIDLICEWENEGNVIFDLKTSSIDYDEGSVLTSPQLTLYMNAVGHEYSTRKCGFIVLKKQILKNRKKICSVCSFNGSSGRHKTCSNEINGVRCGGEYLETISPQVSIQIQIDSIPERTEEIVMQNFIDINNAIKEKTFVRNFSSCMRPWGPCEFRKICFFNDYSEVTKSSDKKK
jgi:hypothetical protein